MLKYIFFDIDGTLMKTKSIIPEVHPDTRQKLLELKKYYKLGIYSQGFKLIQLGKLKLAGILDLFDENNIFISHNKLALVKKIENKYPIDEFLIIDNSEEIIQSLEKEGIHFLHVHSYISLFEDVKFLYSVVHDSKG
ncbi:hypothetical protein A3A69_02120 [candidate division WWE3 bacterium RIFCSPLOWO2_01_FULL_37_15]|uniref:FCP1 homology domain-containing protein n=1 Tax=candidate division WWE3 bacterium RIFCSPLOWO2_01_FULL_37_15 TaxID=1802622 RepID=A0A1F4USC6_UNCKA|nr:MAG: hypothetical protein A3A69_02120 [candidate division WWE3 bacterium RIFCSPLOWO2_01_FULL_37_15]